MTDQAPADNEMVKRVDRIIAILQLAYRDEIEAARTEVLRDAVNAAILELVSTDWVSAGDVKAKVVASTKQASRTVERRLARLVATGVIDQEGAGPKVRYRSTGVL